MAAAEMEPPMGGASISSEFRGAATDVIVEEVPLEVDLSFEEMHAAERAEEAEVIRSPWTTGNEVVSVAPATAAAHDLAERLESIAKRLRTDGTAAVVAGMRGDRFDALLAGLFAGYLAARDLES
jgi:hypothetical protein